MSDPQHYVLNVPQISCNHCKMAIESAVRGLGGVIEVEVEVPDKTVSVRFDADALTLQGIRRAIEEEGYTVAGENELGD
jgi:copper chaperone